MGTVQDITRVINISGRNGRTPGKFIIFKQNKNFSQMTTPQRTINQFFKVK